jgi:uncharacterized membrane protein
MIADPEALARLERHLGRLFVVGLTISASALVCGLVLFFTRPDSALTGVVLNGGLVVLMATPILRVVVSLIEYVRMRDWFFVLTTMVVIVELSVTLLYALQQR